MSEQRGSRYVFSYRVAGRQRWESARTLAAARLAKSARRTDIARGEFDERSRVTLHEYAPEWVARYLGRGSRGFRESTRDDYRRQLQQYAFAYFPEGLRLTEVSPSKVAGFIGWLCDGRKQAEAAHALAVQRAEDNGTAAPPALADDAVRKLSDATVRNIMAPLRACLATAVREGLIRTNPARDIDLPHRAALGDDDEGARALSREQLATFLLVVPARHRLLFEVIAATGLRISEVIALEWGHVQLDGSSPHVKVRQAFVRGRMGPPKSRTGRRDVPIGHELVRALRKHRGASDWHRDGDPVFPSEAGTILSPGNMFRRVLKPAAEEAGVPWMGFHTLRHTCATLLFAEGRNAVQVQRWLGHHSAAFTLATYVHLLDGDIGAPLDIAKSANRVQTYATPSDATSAPAEVVEIAA